MKFLGTLFMLLLVIGGLNWGLVGAFNFDLVATLLGDMTMGARLVYILVGVAAVMKLFCMLKGCGSCKSSDS